jgi:hypothetical protein
MGQIYHVNGRYWGAGIASGAKAFVPGMSRKRLNVLRGTSAGIATSTGRASTATIGSLRSGCGLGWRIVCGVGGGSLACALGGVVWEAAGG